MKHTPSLKAILLVLVLLVIVEQVGGPVVMWDERLVPVGRVHQARNSKRNRERWARRWRCWQRQQPSVGRARRRRRRLHLLQQWLKPIPGGTAPAAGVGQEKRWSDQPTAEPEPPDPLADLRQQRGWIDRMSERELWRLLIRLRWPYGAVCPCCLEHDPQYLQVLDPDYRGGLGRWRCRVCAEAGDAGEGGTFTPLTGTLLEGTRLDARSLWLLVELFADGRASVEAASEARVNRHTADRLNRLLRAAIYHTRSQEPLVLTPEQVTEFDEVRLRRHRWLEGPGWRAGTRPSGPQTGPETAGTRHLGQ